MTSDYHALWPAPPSAPWPETQDDSTGLGADFPESPGDREKGKFRPSDTPRLTQIAVVNDDGTVIGHVLVESNEEMIFWLKAMYAGLVAKGFAEDVTDGLLFE